MTKYLTVGDLKFLLAGIDDDSYVNFRCGHGDPDDLGIYEDYDEYWAIDNLSTGRIKSGYQGPEVDPNNGYRKDVQIIMVYLENDD